MITNDQRRRLNQLEDDLIFCGLRYRLTGQAVLFLYRHYLRAKARFFYRGWWLRRAVEVTGPQPSPE